VKMIYCRTCNRITWEWNRNKTV